MLQVASFSLGSGEGYHPCLPGDRLQARISVFVSRLFWFRVAGLGFRLSGVQTWSRIQALGSEFRVPECGFRISGFKFRCRVSGSHTISRTPSAAGLAAQASASARPCAGPPPPHLEETCDFIRCSIQIEYVLANENYYTQVLILLL